MDTIYSTTFSRRSPAEIPPTCSILKSPIIHFSKFDKSKWISVQSYLDWPSRTVIPLHWQIGWWSFSNFRRIKFLLMLLLMAAMMFWLALLMIAVFGYMALKKRLCDIRRGCMTRRLEERLGDLMIWIIIISFTPYRSGMQWYKYLKIVSVYQIAHCDCIH